MEVGIHMKYVVLTCKLGIAFLIIFLQACAIYDLKGDVDRADSSYGLLRVAPIDRTPGSDILLLVYRQTGPGPQLINHRMPLAGQESLFLVPIAEYRIVAFEDVNHDFIYQPGEPAASSDEPPLYTGVPRGKEALQYESVESLKLHLSADYQLPWSVDLSAQMPQEQISRAKQNYLQLTTWDNPAFSEDNVRKGLWQPLTFYEQTGYGLYLLEELDPAKQPLLLVHGINGSPLNFRALAAELSEDYQLLLFQYPSGFSLEYSAYVLHRAVSDFLGHRTNKELHILAHSMGGLLSRGMLLLNNAETNARISTYITLATPWSGHDAARLGVEWAPVIAPVWRSMAPDSSYLQRIFAEPLAESIEHYLFFSSAHSRNGPSKGDDGVVTVRSQLSYHAQKQASAVYGIEDNHSGIINNPCTIATVQMLLERANIAGSPPRLKCNPGFLSTDQADGQK
ncbi:MAG: alpha/beta fold hydrolase [Halieaceae bacterium]|jgi:pimeloyl-ACP methyl ester carboxylesterase|nr:alpha/beta fold hydrolase [Halieaceae bacterium]